ncbi:MAG: MBL fold metallo-hydrolase [Dehalococcoidia bacterium]
MLIRILGCHHTETAETRLSSIMIDQALIVDAGAITSTLTDTEQSKIVAVLLTHQHLDHVRDVPTLALNGRDTGKTVPVYGTKETLTSVQTHLLNDQIYPDFTRVPSTETPRIRMFALEPLEEREIFGYQVTPVSTTHCDGSVGYFIKSASGVSCYYSGDTNGEGLASAWHNLNPDLVIVEITFPNSQESLARLTNHMTPQVLESEIAELQRRNGGKSPQFVVTHLNAERDAEIREEIQLLSNKLGVSVIPAHEGLLFEI